MVTAIHHAIVRNRLIFGQKNDFYRVVSDSRDFEPLIKAAQDGDREPVNDDREENKPIYH